MSDAIVYQVFSFQNVVVSVVSLGLFVLKAWAFLDALTRRKEEYVAADKLTKPAWTIILGVALAAHMLFWDPINLLGIIGTIAAIVYLVDVRPAIRSLTRR
ncbi:MAG: hypothetical protein AVDCRST_MAG72-1046 [uncultured Nocardioidaceae bacterium]|uniref:DUF2516 family protein n=1 Tax=uncultured Nocardioidaceae bacterium TaxID=253824 RepID=A0A6J4M2U2_9ACTN|nr:MAG: hypothetical protein AVDCRST_MAG72-1046 [uncultured Nocardioidaceae bacterium]